LYYTIKGRDRTENAAVLEQHKTLVFIAFQVFSRVFFVFLHCVQDRPASYIVARASTVQNLVRAAKEHPNRPKVILLKAPDPSSTEVVPREDPAASGATENGTGTQMLPNGPNII